MVETGLNPEVLEPHSWSLQALQNMMQAVVVAGDGKTYHIFPCSEAELQRMHGKAGSVSDIIIVIILIATVTIPVVIPRQ